MQLTINGLSFSMLFILGVIGALIFIGFGLYRRLILPIILSKDSGPAHQKNVSRLEIIAWGIYFIAVIYYSLLASLPVTVILLALAVFAFFDFWKNYFAGIILKFGDKIQIGDSITVNEYTGKVLEFGYRALKIISPMGEEILIPYQLVNTEVKIGQKSTPEVLFKTFVLDGVNKGNTGGRPQLEKAMHNNPWIIISKPIQIAMEDQQATLSFYVLNDDFFEKAKDRLRKNLGS